MSKPNKTTTATPAKGPKPPEQSFDEAWDDLTKDEGAPDPDEEGGETTEKEETDATETDEQRAAAEQEGQPEGEDEPEGGETQPAQSRQDEGEDEQEEDLWAGLNETQRQALQELNNRLATAEHRAASDAGRIAAFQQKLKDVLEKQGSGAAKQPTAEQVKDAMKTPEGWEQLKQDYPSIAGPIEAALRATEERVTKQITEVVKSKVEPLLEARQADEDERARQWQAQQVKILTDAYPDWRSITTGKDFGEWLAKQPPLVRAGVKSPHAADAIQILDLYNSSKSGDTVTNLTQRRQRRLQQAATTQGRSSQAAAISRQREIPDDFDAAWDEMERRSAGQKK